MFILHEILGSSHESIQIFQNFVGLLPQIFFILHEVLNILAHNYHASGLGHKANVCVWEHLSENWEDLIGKILLLLLETEDWRT